MGAHAMLEASAQADAPKNNIFPPPQPLDLQAHRLLQRFSRAPEVARTIASLAFAAEARA
jgi:hypothetical protein